MKIKMEISSMKKDDGSVDIALRFSHSIGEMHKAMQDGDPAAVCIIRIVELLSLGSSKMEILPDMPALGKPLH